MILLKNAQLRANPVDLPGFVTSVVANCPLQGFRACGRITLVVSALLLRECQGIMQAAEAHLRKITVFIVISNIDVI